MTIGEYWKRINTLHLCYGLNPMHTQNQAQTLKWLEVLYRTWTDVDLDKHKSHLGIYQPPTLVPINKTRKALCAWDTIGIRTSKAVEDRFGSIKRAANGTVREWAEIEIITDKGKVRRLGDKDAAHIVAFLEGENG
jgi:hypothetical protein